MKNGVHLSNRSKAHILQRSFPFILGNRFFQRMGTFAVYFTISLLALIVRGYYRLPSTCLEYEKVGKDDSDFKTKIIDRSDCHCHYTNFLWRSSLFNDDNRTIFNSSTINLRNDRHFEPTALVR